MRNTSIQPPPPPLPPSLPAQSSSVGLESNQWARRAETRSFFDERVSLTGAKWPENDNVVQRRRVVGSNDSPSSAPSAGSSRLLTRPPLEFGVNTRSHRDAPSVALCTDPGEGVWGGRKEEMVRVTVADNGETRRLLKTEISSSHRVHARFRVARVKGLVRDN